MFYKDNQFHQKTSHAWEKRPMLCRSSAEQFVGIDQHVDGIR